MRFQTRTLTSLLPVLWYEPRYENPFSQVGLLQFQHILLSDLAGISLAVEDKALKIQFNSFPFNSDSQAFTTVKVIFPMAEISWAVELG